MEDLVEHRYGRDDMRLVTASFRTHRFVPHAHSEYAVAAIERGVEAVRYRGATEHAPAGSLLLLDADTIHAGRPGIAEGWDYRVFYIPQPLLAELAGHRPAFSAPAPHDPRLAARLIRLHRRQDQSSLAAQEEFEALCPAAPDRRAHRRACRRGKRLPRPGAPAPPFPPHVRGHPGPVRAQRRTRPARLARLALPGVDEYTSPEFSRSALLTIDLQRDFVAGIAGTAEVLPAVRRLTDAFREAGRPIVHVVRLYLPDGSNADLCRRTLRGMVAPHSPGSQLTTGLLPGGPAERELDPDLLVAGHAQEIGPDEHILYKPRWSAFFGTRLLEHIAERAVSTVVVAGCNYPNCPRSTLVDATERDLRAVAVRDALSGWTAGAGREMAGMGIACLDTGEVVAGVRSRAASSA